MVRRFGATHHWVTSQALLLAVGCMVIAPAQKTPDSLPAAAGVLNHGATTQTVPMRTRLPHEAEPVATLYVEARPSAPPAAAPLRLAAIVRFAGGSRFNYGYCTWWVAQKRAIPWSGNAWQWWGNARAAGFAEGSRPVAGAIMVMGIGPSSPQGHVAYVESAAADGSFTVSEMNWWGVPGGGWGRVDVRRVTSYAGIVGFIY